jgi:hypothetical protein
MRFDGANAKEGPFRSTLRTIRFAPMDAALIVRRTKMQAATPVTWYRPNDACEALSPLFDHHGDRRMVIDNILVRLGDDNVNFPMQRARYREARLVIVDGSAFWLDAVTRKPLWNVSGWRLP